MADLAYRKLFDPSGPAQGTQVQLDAVADRAPPSAFLFDESIVLAINVALAAGRPLLLRGGSGVGKTSVARAISWRQGWSFVPIVVTSRTLARDFLYQVDDLKRLQDAYANRPIDDMRPYLIPGPLFWAFEPDFARSILAATGRSALVPAGVVEHAPNTVVLVDEIDKADPDVPNNLLDPLGQLSFEGPELPRRIAAPADRAPLIVLTTNEERDLPAAFLRRCVEHRIERPDPERLRRIGMEHFKDKFDGAHHDIVVKFEPGSTAEYLDALRACGRLTSAGTTLANVSAIVQAVLGGSAGTDS